MYRGPAILQLSSDSDAYVIDLIGLNGSLVLDKMLTHIFTNKNSVILGFSFANDLKMLKKNIKEMNFYRTIANLCDV